MAGNYDDVSVFALSDEREETLLNKQTECCLMWTTDSGDPVGVYMNFVWANGSFWLTATKQRARMKAYKKRPRGAIAITSRGTDIGISQAVTYKGDIVLHESDDVKKWFYPALAARVRPESAERQAAFVERLQDDGGDQLADAECCDERVDLQFHDDEAREEAHQGAHSDRNQRSDDTRHVEVTRCDGPGARFVLQPRRHDERQRTHRTDRQVEGVGRKGDEERKGQKADRHVLTECQLERRAAEERVGLPQTEHDHEADPQIDRAEPVEAESREQRRLRCNFGFGVHQSFLSVTRFSGPGSTLRGEPCRCVRR